jgi:hypothetical protein
MRLKTLSVGSIIAIPAATLDSKKDLSYLVSDDGMNCNFQNAILTKNSGKIPAGRYITF